MKKDGIFRIGEEAMDEKEKKAEVEKFYKCTVCKKDCVPAASVKTKGEKERHYCRRCLKERMKPTEF